MTSVRGMPAPKRARVIDGRIGLFAATRVRPDRVRGGSIVLQVGRRIHDAPAPTLVDRRRSWRRLLWRDRRAICRDNLWLIEENLTAPGLDQYLQPMHVVIAVRLVVAKSFDPRKVLEPAPL